MKKLTSLLAITFVQLVLICSNSLFAQCPFPVFGFGVGAVSPVSGTTVVMETCNFPDEYCTVTNVQAGTTYSVNVSGGSGNFVVVYNSTSAPIAWGTSPVTFTALNSGTFYSSSFIGTACGSDFFCNQTAWTTLFPGTTVNATACSNYTWALNNQTYTSSGVYTDSVPAGGGYNYYYLNLTIQNIGPANLAVTTNPSNVLTVQSSTGTYQWMDCTTNQPINGATSQSYTPTQTGSYAVILSSGTCTDTSACTNVFIPTYQYISTCNSYTWTTNGQTYSTSGTYVNSTSVLGGTQLDYLVLDVTFQPVNLTIANSGNTLTSQSNSGTYQWINCITGLPINGATSQTYTPTQSGSYAVILSDGGCLDTSGCVNVFIPTYEYVTSCNAYSWPTSGQTYSSSGTYGFNTPFLGGSQTSYLVLDVIFQSSDLTVTTFGSTLTSQSNSGTYQWIDCATNLPIIGETNQSFTPTQTGNYAVIIADGSCVDTSACAFGMVPIYEYATSCGDYTWSVNNQTYTDPGTYSDNSQVSGGMQTTYLVLSSAITPVDLVVINSANVLTSQANATSYQWIDCATNQPISGATNQLFEPTQSGSYAVIIEINSCEDTSACTVIQGVGLGDLSSSIFSIVPNPTNDIVTLSFDGNDASLIITDLHGHIIFRDEVITGEMIDLSEYSSGVYFFNLSNGTQNEILKMIRE